MADANLTLQADPPASTARAVRFDVQRRHWVTGAVIALVVLAVFIVFAAPYLWMIGSTFKARAELFSDLHPLTIYTFVPRNPTLDNLATLFNNTNFLQAIMNSIVVAVLSVVLSLGINSLVAYVLAWLDFPGRRVLFFAILATLMIAFEAKLIPLFLITQRLQMTNTLPAIFVPWLTDAFIIFLLRQHLKDLPEELFEAAIIDGCSYFRIFWNVMLPNIVPALVSAGFIKFIFSWDSFIWPAIVNTDESKTVIPVALAKLFSDDAIRWELVFAGSFVSTIPVIVIFLFLQRYYVQGFLRSGP
ncbi:MAG: carbohydrate ABC transporter permease [Chloroflexi bacterium]|nr:carbohydrate ABC transporter permease [Chloroflexota bacterium]